MNRVCRVLCVMVLSVGVGVGTVPDPAKASGIPTVDIAQIVQSLTSYITDLQGFSELIIQTGLEESQLASLLQQYTQTLREYKSYLNQLRSLQEFISAPDWAALLKIIVGSPYGQEILAEIPLLNPEGADYKNEVRKRLGEYGSVPQETAEVVKGYTDLGVEAGDLAHIEAYNDGLNKSYAKYAQQMSIVSNNEGGITEREKKFDILANELVGLGEESDLATAQLGVSHQNVAGHQREAIIRTLNQTLLLYESPSTALANRRAGFVDQEIERLKKVHGDSTNHTLGRDRWATDW